MRKESLNDFFRTGSVVSALVGLFLLGALPSPSPAQDAPDELDFAGSRPPAVFDREILLPARIEAPIIEELPSGEECAWLDAELSSARLELDFQATVLFSRSMPDIELVLTAGERPEAATSDGIIVEWKGDVVGTAESLEAGETVNIPLFFNLAKADSSRMELRIRGAGADAAAVMLPEPEDPTAGPHLLLIDHYRRR